jgi:hypothetical protein
MRPDNENEDDDEEIDEDFSESTRRGSAKFPGIVMAAGVIWICFGALGMIGSLLGAMAGGMNQQGGAGPNMCSNCVSGLIAFAFLYCGYQTVTGKAAGTLGNGIGSLVIGALITLCGTLITVGGGVLAAGNFGGGNNAGVPNNLLGGILAAVGVLYLVFGLTLVLAGVFALMGRNAYRDWKEVNSPRSRRRKRRNVEVEDQDELDEDDRDETRPRR